MKPVLLLLFAATLQAQTCAHVFRWLPQGAIQAFRNGILQDDSAMTYTPATRTITPTGFTDQDQMIYVYIREIDNPGQVPPSHYSAPIKETQVCTGNLNPPPQPFVPFSGATQNLNLGNFRISAAGLTLLGPTATPGWIYLDAGPCPTSTTAADGSIWDGVLCLDSDSNFKLLKKDGTIAPLAQVTRQQGIGQGVINGIAYTAYGSELWSITSPAGSAQFAAVPASGGITTIPVCGTHAAQSSPSCLQPAKLTDPVLSAPPR